MINIEVGKKYKIFINDWNVFFCIGKNNDWFAFLSTDTNPLTKEAAKLYNIDKKYIGKYYKHWSNSYLFEHNMIKSICDKCEIK